MSQPILNFSSGKVILLDKSITGDIVLEEKYNGETITAIGTNACFRGKLKTLDLSKTLITSIEVNSFYNCESLTSIILPDSLKSISMDAFRACSSTSFHIPKRLESFIGAFNQCKMLKTFTKDESNDNFDIDHDIVYSKDRKKIIRASCEAQFEDITYINMLESIEQYAFSGTLIRIFIAGSSLTSIERGAFESCKQLIDVNLIQSKLKMISYVCFSYAHIIHLILPPKLLTISSLAFSYCNISLLLIPNTIKSISADAFYEQKGELTIFYFGRYSFEEIKMFERCAFTPIIYVPYSYKYERLSTVNVTKCSLKNMYAPLDNICTKGYRHFNNLTFVLVLAIRS